jgi:hypothetical protein
MRSVPAEPTSLRAIRPVVARHQHIDDCHARLIVDAGSSLVTCAGRRTLFLA